MNNKLFSNTEARKEQPSGFNLMALLALASFIFLMLAVPAASAKLLITNIDQVEQYSCVELTQSCSNCTFVNITSVYFPNKTISTVNVAMTKVGVDYNYSFCKTASLGDYRYSTFGDPDGVNTAQPVTFEVTPNGRDNEIWFFVAVTALFYGIGFFGYFGKNQWIAILGGLGMIPLGIYLFSHGISEYRDFITDVIATITIGLGALFSIHAGVSLIEENV